MEPLEVVTNLQGFWLGPGLEMEAWRYGDESGEKKGKKGRKHTTLAKREKRVRQQRQK